ncbi:hypothetical protein ALP98_101556 [Pseudomonas viridiflava]|uniref:Uncharacterized protein n=2 Tax=Pseudomonas syringae group TaxID=136849 RepID=A0A3M4P801_PSEVI|nr:hypothetical protein ALQ30_101160 [Pseudomonas syringae pv. persicae]RMQ15522.1 hypothetical protein ALQ09_101057 [Pseudomonas viridiflava]RMQ74375.1 hypothetical protein ALP98_101556 [Pseudomonas viridiflava]
MACTNTPHALSGYHGNNARQEKKHSVAAHKNYEKPNQVSN